MNRDIFRQYDIRGEAERDLSSPVVRAIARALGERLRDDGVTSVAVGRDVRLSSPRLRDAVTEGLVAAGHAVTDIGVDPTPVLYHAVATGGHGAGVMVTGSHNPIAYNGLKMTSAAGPIFGDAIQALARRAAVPAAASRSGGSVTVRTQTEDYRADALPRLEPSRPLKIALDPGNGASAEFAAPLLRALGHEVVSIYDERDGRFPNHLPDPTVPALVADLIALVGEVGADIGLGFDGDGDRVGVIDDRGRIVFGDQILALLARDFLGRCPGEKVLFDVKCSRALPEVIREAGGEPVMGPTGHSLIKSRMKADGIRLAGEMSGHLFLGEDWYGFDDAFFAAGRFLQALAAQSEPLSAVVDGLPQYVATPEIRVDCDDAAKFEIVGALVEHFRAGHEVVDVDGARVELPEGWGLVRASNTQPVLVFRFEAQTPEALRAIHGEFADALKAFPHVELPVPSA